MVKLFKNTTATQQEFSLSAFLPQGKAFESVNIPSSNFGKFITGLAGELKRAYDDLNNISEDYDINVTDELLSRWESALGIPDDCFSGSGSKADRRLNVLLKFAKMNVQTAPQMVELAVALGFPDTTIQPLQETSLPPYNVPFIPTDSPGSRYVIVVFASNAVTNIPPYDVPFIPAAENRSLLRCVMETVKPSNVNVLYGNYNPSDFSPITFTNCKLWLDASDSDTVIETSNLVSQWTDKSGNNNHALQTTGSLQPTTNATTQNDLNVIDFDGTVYLSGASNLNQIPSGENTAFVVSKRASEDGSFDTIFSIATGSRDDYFNLYSSVSGAQSFKNRTSVGGVVSSTGNTNTDFNITTVRRVSIAQGISVNNELENYNLLAQDVAAADSVTIGSDIGMSLPLVGSIAEFIIYDRFLTGEEVASIVNYLSSKWDITLV